LLLLMLLMLMVLPSRKKHLPFLPLELPMA